MFNKNLVRFVVCWNFVVDSLSTSSWVFLSCCDVSSPVCCALNPFCLLESPFFSFEFLVASMLWPRKGSLMKTQTRILDNRLYNTRKTELHSEGKKSRTVQVTPILICGIWCSPHLTGICGTGPFLGGSGRRVGTHTPPAFPKMPTASSAFPLLGAPQAPGDEPPPEEGKSLGKAPWGRRKSPGTETHSARSVPQITRYGIWCRLA